MSTVQEIEAAIERLPVGERDAFEGRLIARRFGVDVMDGGDYGELLASLDEAEREIDAGRGVTADDLRKSVAQWAGR